MTLKGRYWTLFWLFLFLGVAFVVLGRQNAALQAARRLERLREVRQELEARKVELEQRIVAAASREVLVPRVERTLGLRNPASHDYEILRLPAPAGVPR